MKVLFTFGGLPHYYNKVLNRINALPDTEVVVVSPEAKTSTVGAGVKQDESDVEFKLIRLPEKNAWYGKAFFENMLPTLQAEKPDIIVLVWPYVLGFLYNRKIFSWVKKNGVKIVFKDIPFMLPKMQDALRFYHDPRTLSMNEPMIPQKTGFMYDLRMKFLTWSRRQYYTKLIDAHVNYVEGAEEILATYGVDPATVFVTYNSPDTDVLFATKENIAKLPKMLPENPHRLLHVGRLVKWKRVDLLLEAFVGVKKEFPQAELLVIGKGPELENLKQQAENLQLGKAAKFVGGVYNPDDLGRYFCESAAYVLAGMGGLSLNEAMAFGRPVICSVCDGTEKHLLYEGENGFYFEEGNAADLEEKIKTLFRSPKLVEQFGKRSEEIIRQRINIQTVVERYREAFEHVIGK